jgi:putative ABC transport system permease protein
MATLLLGGFAMVALALAALGIFGLMAHEANRRTQEIGVRLALGAEPWNIGVAGVWRAVKLVGVGLVLGTAGAWYAGTLVKNLLFETTSHDLSSYVAAGVLLAATVLASLWPALRAARINPVQALRHE